MRKMTPDNRACLEFARRMVCGDRDDVYVSEDGTVLVGSAAFKLEPSRDEIDALIVAISQALKLHLGGVELAELRRDLAAAGIGEQFADSVHDHLVELLEADWDALRARINYYGDDNARVAAFDTKDAGDT